MREVSTGTLAVSLTLGSFCFGLEVFFASHMELMVMEVSLHILNTHHNGSQHYCVLNVLVATNVLK